MSMRFSPEEIQELADLVAEKVAARLPPHPCPFDPESQQVLAGLAQGVKSARRTAGATIVGALVLGAISFIGWSILKWLDVRITGGGTAP